ncbi:BRO-N domain-containing protein [Blautia wexlerae]|uniref:BRO-N domain-containing protein n=1 Tax=Blautia wexlerae TaxID=418240 RepID=UPI0032F03E91
MSTYTTNTKPDSKFEDVPEEVLTDPTMRTALGMDPIPGMNTPVDDASNICGFVNEHSGMNLKSVSTTANDDTTLTVINEQEVLGKHFRIFGTIDNPLFLAKDVAEWIEHSDVSTMMRNVDPDEKVTNNVCTPGGVQKSWFLTEDGLYEVLMQSRKPIAKSFKKKVKEILKSIRKNGAYIRNQENMTPAEIVARGLIAAQNIINEKEKEIAILNGRCGLLTQAVDDKQDIINAISRNVPAPTKRMMLNRVMRRRSPELAQSRWSYLYTRFEEIYHKNVKIRMKNYNAEQGHRKCTSILDFIDTGLNMLDELYDLAVKLFESDFTQLMQEMHLLRMTDEEYEDEEYWKRVL